MSIDVEPRAALDDAAGVTRSPEVNRIPGPPRLPGRRNPKWIALGVIALCLGGLLSYVVYSRAATETPVVVVAQTVYRGETVERSDLTVTTVRGGSLEHAIPSAELDAVVGRKAALDLPEGAVIPRSALTDDPQPAPGRAVVGLKLSTGRAPAGLLVPGAPVRLIAMAAATEGQVPDKLGGTAFAGRVVGQQPGPDGASVVVDVDVDAAAAPSIAVLAAQDRIALVRDADR